MVIVLTLTMIIGVITVVSVIVTRMPQSFVARPAPLAPIFPENIILPENITLPDGVKPQAITFGTGWTAVVTEDNRILVFGPKGALLQEVAIATGG